MELNNFRENGVNFFDFYLKKTIGAIVFLFILCFFMFLLEDKKIVNILYSDVSIFLAFIGFFSLFVKIKESFVLFFKSWFSGFGAFCFILTMFFYFFYSSFWLDKSDLLFVCFFVLNYISVFKIKNSSNHKKSLFKCIFSQQHLFNFFFILYFFSLLIIIQLYLSYYLKTELNFAMIFSYYLGSIVYHFCHILTLHVLGLFSFFNQKEDNKKKENRCILFLIKIESLIYSVFKFIFFILIILFCFVNVIFIVKQEPTSELYFFFIIISNFIFLFLSSLSLKKDGNETFKIIAILQLINANVKTNINYDEIHAIKPFLVRKDSDLFMINYLLNYLNRTSYNVKNKNQLILYLIAKNKICFKNDKEIEFLQQKNNVHHVINEDEINIKKIKNYVDSNYFF